MLRTTKKSAVEITGADQHRCWGEKVAPPLEELADGVWSIPVPVPIEALRYVLCYVFEQPDGLTVIDPGWGGEEAFSAFDACLGEIGRSVADVAMVAVTHFHPDHAGLASQLRSTSGAEVAIHPADLGELDKLWQGADPWISRNVELLVEMGASRADAVEATKDGPNGNWGEPFVPEVLLADDDLVPRMSRKVRAIWTPGHTPGHLCYLDEATNLMLSGDHVLTRVTPNVTVTSWPIAPDHDPLGDYLASLDRLLGRSPTQVLPAHYWRFSNLDARLIEIKEHHDARLSAIAAVVDDGPLSTWEIASRLRWSRPWSSFVLYARRAALGETLAHLVYLARVGRIRQVSSAPTTWAPS